MLLNWSKIRRHKQFKLEKPTIFIFATLSNSHNFFLFFITDQVFNAMYSSEATLFLKKDKKMLLKWSKNVQHKQLKVSDLGQTLIYPS